MKRTKKEPLKPLPVITTPWTRIAIDVIRLLSRRTTGFKYFGTRFIKAIPMKKVDAAATCDALLKVFTCFGVPKEILSDHGSPLHNN